MKHTNAKRDYKPNTNFKILKRNGKFRFKQYGIKDVKEIIHNPSYDVLFAEETKPGLEGFEKGQVTELVL